MTLPAVYTRRAECPIPIICTPIEVVDDGSEDDGSRTILEEVHQTRRWMADEARFVAGRIVRRMVAFMLARVPRRFPRWEIDTVLSVVNRDPTPYKDFGHRRLGT